MAKVPNAVEILPKILTAWIRRTSVTDDTQTTHDTGAAAQRKTTRGATRHRASGTCERNLKMARCAHLMPPANYIIFSHTSDILLRRYPIWVSVYTRPVHVRGAWAAKQPLTANTCCYNHAASLLRYRSATSRSTLRSRSPDFRSAPLSVITVQFTNHSVFKFKYSNKKFEIELIRYSSFDKQSSEEYRHYIQNGHKTKRPCAWLPKTRLSEGTDHNGQIKST